MNELPELLAPAGSPEALQAAIEGGANAAYFGGKSANARNSAKNFSDGEILWAIEQLHKNHMRSYITLNTLLTDRELPEALEFAELCHNGGADAFIVADLGLARLLKERFPKTALHASTQAAGHNTDSAKKFFELGFSRVVAARELDCENLKYLIGHSPIEIELFVHGALCCSHSGRCHMSLALGGSRSANRGSCAQPCRQRYDTTQNGGYALSLKDLCLAGHIKEILELSPASLKIEGRMKPPEYVYNVCKIYRKCIDERRDATPSELGFLSGVFSRQGFTDGYFAKKLGAHMFGVRTEQNIAESKKHAESFAPAKKLPEQIPQKTATPVAKSQIILEKTKNIKINPKLCLIFASSGQYLQVADFIQSDEIQNKIYRIFLPLGDFASVPERHKNLLGARLPYVIFDSEKEAVANTLKKAGARSVLVDNIGHIDLSAGLGLEMFGDFGLNVTNSRALAEYKKMGLENMILSPELNFAQIRDMSKTANCGICAYGKTPVMILENNIPGSDSCLTDKTGAKFLVGREGNRSILYNNVPVYLADKKELYKGLGLFFVALNFTDETPEQIKKIISDYAQNRPGIQPPKKFTRGRR